MTEPRFLLDSNICIYILGGVGAPLREQIEARGNDEIVVSSISFAEVMRGIAPDDRDRERHALQLFDRFEVKPFGRDAASSFRHLPFRRNSFDRLIAAHAVALGLTLVTANTRDFTDISGLRVENWTVRS